MSHLQSCLNLQLLDIFARETSPEKADQTRMTRRPDNIIDTLFIQQGAFPFTDQILA